jgi:hypothetical protein
MHSGSTSPLPYCTWFIIRPNVTVHFIESPDKTVSQVEQVGKCSTKTFESILVRLNLVSEFCMITTNLLIGWPINSAKIAPFHLTQFFRRQNMYLSPFPYNALNDVVARQHYCVREMSALREGEIRFSSWCAIVLLFIILTNNNNIFYLAPHQLFLLRCCVPNCRNWHTRVRFCFLSKENMPVAYTDGR